MEDHRGSIFGEQTDGPDAALSELVEKLIGQGMSPDDVAIELEEAIPGVLPKLGETLLSGLKEHAPAMFEDRRVLRARFSRRLWKIWRFCSGASRWARSLCP